jgi:hypothetical protein
MVLDAKRAPVACVGRGVYARRAANGSRIARAEGDDPVVQEVIVESARAVDECLEDAVVPALARLTRQYASNQTKADSFFRGMRRLLSDLSEEEFAAFRAFVDRILREPLPPGQLVVELVYEDVFPSPIPQLFMFKGQGKAQERVLIGEFGRVARLFHLLKLNDLARESIGRWGVPLVRVT